VPEVLQAASSCPQTCYNTSVTNLKPQSAVLLTRISDARNGITAGVDDQRADLLRYAQALGWRVSHVIEENDTSAFKRRVVALPGGGKALRTFRPKFREALDMLQSGRADGLLVLDLDRLARDPRDLEDLIDVVESRKPPIPVESITGSLRLGNDPDISMARVMVAMANKSSRDTARRVARARQRQAEEGRPRHGGKRPFGFEEGGVIVNEVEAAAIRKAADSIIAGVSLRQTLADLRRSGVPTVTGVPWTAIALRDILTRPRNAGLVVYQGSILEGVKADWDPILSRETWEAVTAILTDPARRTTPGNTPRWLGSLIYRCGHPDCLDADPPSLLRVSTSGNRPRPTYRCMERAHLTRVAEDLDEYISAVLCARLARSDMRDLMPPREPGKSDTGELALQANALRERMKEAKDLWEAGVLSAADLTTRHTRMSDELAKVQDQLRTVSGNNPVADLAGRKDAAEAWAKLDLGRRRAILQALATVWVLPLTKPPGRAPFDPDRIRIEWK
jgi:site-specific DNA recombinase